MSPAEHVGQPSEGARKPGILKNDSSEAFSFPAGSLLGGQHQTASPRSTPKSVSIAPKGELISPLILGDTKDVDDLDLDTDRPRSPRKIRAKGPSSRKLSGRPAQAGSVSSLHQWNHEDADRGTADSGDGDSIGGRSDHHLFDGGFVGQVASWIRNEKAKRDARRARRHAGRISKEASEPSSHAAESARPSHHRRDSEDSVDLDQLEQIIKESFPFGKRSQRRISTILRPRLSGRRANRSSSVAASSDTEYLDGDILVPSAEVVLDNSKTLSYKGGAAAKSSEDLSLTRQTTTSEDAWIVFKAEVLRLIHTLRLKGWRRVPLENSSAISIERLSGALTNAVYVVSPPEQMSSLSATIEAAGARPTPKKMPPKLLLRIYGPQVEHLIDRESELQILRRLCRKNIGPRMLGTFQNGRFEEFLNAKPLTPESLRNPDTSRHIAKRMRELHDGIDLLDSERDEGPFVWRNWDKWLARVQKIVEWLDKTVKDDLKDGKVAGFVCGTEWAMFHDTLFKYRQWLTKELGGEKAVAEELVFAHNDTQYGNILRLLPSATSPLLLPANSHKQLVVIDFEYSNANTPGLEFANHFSEWCYNYHDPNAPWKCSHTLYPKPEDQDRFLRAYVRHRPEFNNVASPRQDPLDTVPESRATSPSNYNDDDGHDGDDDEDHQHQRPSSSISQTLRDARHPPPPSSTPTSSRSQQQSYFSSTTPGVDEPSAACLEWEDGQVRRLARQTRLWRMANSAQWVAWGIVQAEVPGMPVEGEAAAAAAGADDDDDGQEEEEVGKVEVSAAEGTAEGTGRGGEGAAEAEAAEFDYLSYARDRAMLFWGDAVALGFVGTDELPEDVRRDIKVLKY